MIPNPYREYETFLLGIYQELTSKRTRYRFGYHLYESGLLRPTLRLTVTSKDFKQVATIEVDHHDTREAYIEHYRKLCRRLNGAKDKKVAQAQ